MEWILRALPFWLGAAGVLVLDGAIGVQFMIYGEEGGKEVILVEERPEDGQTRIERRKVSGWMRGWIPSFSEASTKGGERQPLLRNRSASIDHHASE